MEHFCNVSGDQQIIDTDIKKNDFIFYSICGQFPRLHLGGKAMGTSSILNSMKSLLRTWTNKQRWFSLINLLVDFESDVSLWRFIILLVYSHPIIKIIKMRRGLNVCLLLLFLPKKYFFTDKMRAIYFQWQTRVSLTQTNDNKLIKGNHGVRTFKFFFLFFFYQAINM